MSIHSLKNKLDSILQDAIDTNKDQRSGGTAADYAEYRYLVGVHQTLEDIKSRIHHEYHKQLRATGEDDESNWWKFTRTIRF